MRFKAGAHNYNGRRNSRGQRCLSKIHKGLDCGNLEKAFKEIDNLKEREAKDGHK